MMVFVANGSVDASTWNGQSLICAGVPSFWLEDSVVPPSASACCLKRGRSVRLKIKGLNIHTDSQKMMYIPSEWHGGATDLGQLFPSTACERNISTQHFKRQLPSPAVRLPSIRERCYQEPWYPEGPIWLIFGIWLKLYGDP